MTQGYSQMILSYHHDAQILNTQLELNSFSLIIILL
jgi:hypothetical protein